MLKKVLKSRRKTYYIIVIILCFAFFFFFCKTGRFFAIANNTSDNLKVMSQTLIEDYGVIELTDASV